MNSVDIEAIARFRRGVDPQVFVNEMVAEGFDRAASEAAIAKVRQRVTRDDRSRGLLVLGVGLLLLAVGVGLTVWTYLGGGGSYVLVWGPVVFGLIAVVRGIGQIADAGQFNHGRLL